MFGPDIDDIVDSTSEPMVPILVSENQFKVGNLLMILQLRTEDD